MKCFQKGVSIYLSEDMIRFIKIRISGKNLVIIGLLWIQTPAKGILPHVAELIFRQQLSVIPSTSKQFFYLPLVQNKESFKIIYLQD